MKTYLKDLTPDEVIRRLKVGEVVKNYDATKTYKIVDGMLCEFLPSGGVNYNIALQIWMNSNFYFETPDELKLEVGKCYKTRDGRKAFISIQNKLDKKFSGIYVGCNSCCAWFNDGCYKIDKSESSFDLISEWSDDDVAEN